MPAALAPPARYPSYRIAPPKLVGGALALDFVNTVEWRGSPDQRGERLREYGELLAWAESAGALERRTRQRLERAAKARPAAAAAALAEAVALRESLAELLAARTPRPALLETLNHWLGRAPERRRIAPAPQGYGWAAAREPEPLLAPLWPVVWSAADLLASGRGNRVRTCADRRCGWLFVDASRGARRRWCSMESCGNRAKARRHYSRQRAS
jgi:predicted RNA-binding Zn ribbon-like protein